MKNSKRQPHADKFFQNNMRKAKPKKRVILPDPKFNDQKVSKFVNHLMYDGKKNTSYEIFYNALDTVQEKMSKEEKSALEIWKQALDRLRLRAAVSVVLLSRFRQKSVRSARRASQ